MTKARLLGAAALGLMVAACGTDPRERTTGGAAAGAATGAAVGALGGPPGVLAGAAIGAGAGAVTGAVTEPRDVNLGRPLWNDPEVRVPGVREGGRSSGRSGGAMASSSNTRQIQQALASRGYDPGPADGVWGPQTRQAADRFARDNNIRSGSRQDLASALGVSGSDTMTGSERRAQGTSSGGRGAVSERDRAYMGGGMVVDENNRGTTGRTGSTMGTTGSTSGGGMSNQGPTMGSPMGNTDARGPTVGPNQGLGGSLGGGRGAPGNLSSPDNPGSGSNSAGSSSQ